MACVQRGPANLLNRASVAEVSFTPAEGKQELGERIYPIAQQYSLELAGRLTGM